MEENADPPAPAGGLRRFGPLGRWSPFLLGCAATAVLALGFGSGASWMVASSQGPTPVLKTIPPGTLQRYGITLAAAPQPPYCGLVSTSPIARRLRSGLVGCAISQSAAEAAATRGASGIIQESVLARVTSSGGLRVGRNRLAWLVVLRGGFGPQRIPCSIARAGVGVLCPPLPTSSLTRVVIVDGLTGQVAAVVIVGVQWGGSTVVPQGLPWTTAQARMVPSSLSVP